MTDTREKLPSEFIQALEALADKMGERCGDHCSNSCKVCEYRNDLRLILVRRDAQPLSSQGQPVLVGKMRQLAEECLRRYEINPEYSAEILHTPDTYKDLLKLCDLAVAPAPPQPLVPLEPEAGRAQGLSAEMLEPILWDYGYDDMEGRWSEMVRVMESDTLWANGKHNGDCTNKPHTCQRCLVESVKKDAVKFAAKLNAALAAD